MPSLLLKINFSCQFVTKQAKLVDLEWHNFRAIFTLWNILTILEYMWGLWRILLKMAPTHPDPVLVQAPSGSCFQFSIDVETTVHILVPRCSKLEPKYVSMYSLSPHYNFKTIQKFAHASFWLFWSNKLKKGIWYSSLINY